MSENFIDIGMYVTYGLLALAALLAVISPVINFIKDISKAKGPLIGLAILAVIVLVAFSLSTGETYEGVTSVMSRWISTGITTVFFLAGLAILAAIFAEVAKIIK